MNILVFVSSSCPHCPKAYNLVRRVVPNYSEQGLSYRKVRVKTTEGKQLSKQYNVRGVPTILFLNGAVEVKRIVGAPAEDSFINEIEKLLGLKKSFFSKVKSLFH